jgi:chromate transporter
VEWASRTSPEASGAAPTFAEATRVWAKIGLINFGGPVGQIALMHRELVEERRWIGEERFLHALNYCMLLPGPEAQQLATYIGWLLHRTRGGLVAGILFVLPGALVMLTLSILYVLYGKVPAVAAAFLGVKAAVLAIVADAVLRLGRRALRNGFMVGVAAAAFAAIYGFDVPFPVIILAAAVLGWITARGAPDLLAAPAKAAAVGDGKPAIIDALASKRELAHAEPSLTRAMRVLAAWLPLWLGPVIALWVLTGPESVWTQIGAFFSATAVVTFGGAYAVLAYVAQAAVDTFGWLTPGEMVDGLGLAETTPGPLIMVLQFVGFIAAFRAPGGLDPFMAGALGALLTTWVTFAPSFLFIFAGAPYVEALRGNRVLAGALSAIGAAVVGVVLNLALWFALHVLFAKVTAVAVPPIVLDLPVLASLDWRALVLAVLAGILMLWLRAGVLLTLGIAAIGGLALAAP